MKNLLIIFLVLITNTLFCQIKPSQIRKGGSTVVEVLVSDTLNGGTLSYKPLGNEVYRYMSPYIDNYWAKSGNNITSSDRLGTLNNQDLIFIRGGVEKGRVDGIGIVAGYNTSYNSQNYLYLPSLTVVPQQNENGEETALCAEVFLNKEEVEEMKSENIEEQLKKDILKETKELPSYKHLQKIEIRTTEFNKTTTNKIKR